jgi:hypothetical protein
MFASKKSVRIMVTVAGMVLALLGMNWLTDWALASAQPLEPARLVTGRR